MKKLRLSKAIKNLMTKKRKSPIIKTKKTHSIVNLMLGGKPIPSEELKKIKSGGLGKDEYEGEGLPEKVLKEGEHSYFDFTFDMRFFHDKEGTIEVSFAKKNSWKHTKKLYEGLSEKQSCRAQAIFERNTHQFISNACYALALACIEKQSEDLTKRREFLKNIVEHTEKNYREILALGHEKILEVTEENGVKIEKSVFIYKGATPQTKEEKEKEMREFLDKVYSAFKKFKQNHVREPKQKDLMSYMFEIYADKQKKISEMFGKHNLTFKMLWLIFRATDNYDDFINNAIRTKRVTSK